MAQFDLDDDSPEIAYFPFSNTEPSTNVSAGWQLLYSVSGAATGPGQVGVGTSSHYTFLDGASLLINWSGTGIDLLGAVSNARYSVSLDGTPSTFLSDPPHAVLVSLDDLPNTNHSLLLTTIITNATSPDAFLAFDKARLTYAPPPGLVNTTATSQTIDDAEIAFMGAWSYVTDSSGNAMHASTSAGDRAEANFTGSAITLYGLSSSFSGNFTVTLDNTTTTLSALSSYNNSDTLLFYATDLSMNVSHHISVVNQENRSLALRVGGINVTSFGNLTTSTTSLAVKPSVPAGTIAAAVLASVLLLVISGILYYSCCMRRKARARIQPTLLPRQRKRFKEHRTLGAQRAIHATPPSSRDELESASLSTTKGYGFGLGLRREFPFAYRKGKTGSDSSAKSRNGTGPLVESHPMMPQYDRDEKRFSAYTLTEDLPLVPESEKLAPGWSNPVARTRHYKITHGILLPELRITPTGPVDDDDDTDVKTLTSRQDETLAATLSLSPRTSEALAAFDGPTLSKPNVHTPDRTKQSHQTQFLRVRDTSPFRVDVSAILGTRKEKRDSRTTSGSGASTWSKVRSRLYRKAHRDDGRRSCSTDKPASSSSSPESVPVVMHESNSAHPPSETAPDSGTYSFLDLTSSHVSLRPYSKATVSSTPAEVGHGRGEVSTWSEDTSVRMVRIERSRDDMAPKPDAPSTASGGSQPSDTSGAHTSPSAPTTTHTQRSSPFPFPLTIPSSTDVIPPSISRVGDVANPTTSPDRYSQLPRLAPPELTISPANSPTESVPFSVSEIQFRHSFSDYAGFDSQRGSVSSALPPHPPLPHRDGSQTGSPRYPQPPPYIVQRVLGLETSPLTPISPPSLSTSRSGRLGTASSQPGTFRVGSLLGPRPRPSTAGSIRGSAAPQLPMQGGRLRSPR